MYHSLIQKSAVVLLLGFWFTISSPSYAFSLSNLWSRMTADEFSPEWKAKQITQGIDDEALKAQKIFNWITENISYDVQPYTTGRLGFKTTRELMRDKKGLCDDYAHLFQEMAISVGLRSRIVTGFVHQNGGAEGLAEHAWNEVEIKGQTYWIDTTWGAGQFDPATKQFLPRKDLRFFMMNPSQMLLLYKQDQVAGGLDQQSYVPLDTFNSIQANTRKLSKIGFPVSELRKTLGTEEEASLPVAQEVADQRLIVRAAPLKKPALGEQLIVDVSHSPGTSLILRKSGADIPFQRTGSRASRLEHTLNTTDSFSILYRMADGGLFQLLQY